MGSTLNQTTPRVGLPEPRRLVVLDVDECLALLKGQDLGRLAFLNDGRPAILPVNYLLDQGTAVFRYAYGTVLDSIPEQRVAFEVDHTDPASHAGWSVVVEGKAEEVWRPEELADLRALTLHPWAPGNRAHYVRILSSAVTGRRIV